jgi:hypothetical protein
MSVDGETRAGEVLHFLRADLATVPVSAEFQQAGWGGSG